MARSRDMIGLRVFRFEMAFWMHVALSECIVFSVVWVLVHLGFLCGNPCVGFQWLLVCIFIMLGLCCFLLNNSRFSVALCPYYDT